jgi:tripartite-type tricarboxylate transporter receptor subunit TctC
MIRMKFSRAAWEVAINPLAEGKVDKTFRVTPKNTPADIVDKLNKEINAGLVDPKLKARFADLGAAVFPGSPSDFAKFIATETEKWAKVIKFSGAKAD